MQMIEYTLCPSDPHAHLFDVAIKFTPNTGDPHRLWLPNWIPGSYMIRDFARHVVEITADQKGCVLPISKLDKHSWQVTPLNGEPIEIRYRVFAFDSSVRAAFLDQLRGFFNGTSVFLAIEGREDEPVQLNLEPPTDPQWAHWRVATSLQEAGAERYGFGLYSAENYDELIDHPVELGDFSLATFSVFGVQHDIVIAGQHNACLERLCRDLREICHHHINFFGKPAPMERYLFLINAVGKGYGGLEHRNSTALLCSRYDLPETGSDKKDKAYRTFLALCSHEYFHSWNVKRIKPDTFMPYQLTRETHTEQLWLYEGVTSYYDELSLVRCGLIGHDDYLEMLAETITRVQRGLGRKRQTVAESSFDAWTRFYLQDANAANAIVSYYTKGSLIALALDLSLRRNTQHQCSLDLVMQTLWQEFGRTGQPTRNHTVIDIIERLTGLDYEPFFDKYLYNTDEIPLEELLTEVGIGLKLRVTASIQDKGGKQTTEHSLFWQFGATISSDIAGVKIVSVHNGSAAEDAGMSPGDLLVAFDGVRVSAENFNERFQRHTKQCQRGDQITMHVFRDDRMLVMALPLRAPMPDTAVLSITNHQRAIDWLDGCAFN
ncbi:M61 family peptidase [Corallincola luteus]|uniref:M61 family peptidase n=2 Tax=Corallincola luteus TaxID=1775177 RepID=A0ABY2AKN8_9GAMM|nr:M61 family peptidase [Corallincola luteus]